MKNSQPMPFKFLPVINYGNGKIPIIFQHEPKLFNMGGVGVGWELEAFVIITLNDTVSGF